VNWKEKKSDSLKRISWDFSLANLRGWIDTSRRLRDPSDDTLSESLVRILTGLNRDLEGLLRATAAMRPYFGENAKDGKFPHLLIQLNKALDVQVRSAEQVREVISQARHRDF
jgi:hypothetical protein